MKSRFILQRLGAVQFNLWISGQNFCVNIQSIKKYPTRDVWLAAENLL